MIIGTLKTERKPVEHYVEHQGRALRYVTVGEGPPLLLAHGGNGSAENFDTWFDDLGALRTLVIPDLPGFGESKPLAGPHDAGALSLALDTVVADIGADQVDLGGLCFGACVALGFARRHPDKVRKLILHTPLIERSFMTARFRRQVRFLVFPPTYPIICWAARRRGISDWWKRTFTEGVVEEDTGADVNFINQQRCSTRAAREWALSAINSNDTALVRGWRRPILIVSAADDRIADIAAIARLAQGKPNVTLAVLENAGHGWSRDFVARQNSVLGAFLNGDEIPESARVRSIEASAVRER